METLKRVIYALAAFALGLSALLGVIEVVTRYFLGVSHSSVEAIMPWLILAGVLLCAGPALDDGIHVGVDHLMTYMSLPVRRLAHIVSGLAGLAFASVLAWRGADFVAWAIRLNEQSLTEVQMPMAVPYAFIPIGACLLAVFQVVVIVRHARGGAR